MLPISTKLIDGELDDKLRLLYGDALEAQKQKYLALTDAFEGAFGESDDAVLFSAPGRSEIGGNHTDHQLGRVLAATVTVDTRAVVAPRNDNIVRIHSQGYTPRKRTRAKRSCAGLRSASHRPGARSAGLTL